MTRQHLHGMLLAVLAVATAWPAAGQTAAAPPELTATLGAERTRLYAGESFDLTLTIRARGVRLGKEFNLAGLPPTDVVELGAFRELPQTQEQVNGELVQVHRFRCTGRAIQPGSVQFATRLEVQTVVRQRMVIGSTWITTPRRVPVPPLTLTVRALPQQGRPDGFRGAVGDFSFQMIAEPTEIAVGDLVTVRMTIAGQGPLDAVRCPVLEPGRHFKIYPPRRMAVTAGDKVVFEQTVVPQNTNAAALPPVGFTYFQPVTGEYRTIVQGPIPFTHKSRERAAAYTPYRPPPNRDAAATGRAASLVESARHKAVEATGPWSRRSPLENTALGLRLAAAALLGGGLLVALSGFGTRTRPAPRRRAGWRGGGLTLLALLAWFAADRVGQAAAARLPDHVMDADATARLAPAHSAKATVELPEGTVVKTLETWEHWIKIADGERRGWVPADAVRPVTD